VGFNGRSFSQQLKTFFLKPYAKSLFSSLTWEKARFFLGFNAPIEEFFNFPPCLSRRIKRE
jgi:hypothetical protein